MPEGVHLCLEADVIFRFGSSSRRRRRLALRLRQWIELGQQAEDESDWEEWVALFSLTREPDKRPKGLV
ncbi:MAG TPA: hypothetical protein VGB25_06400, partial [Candidatus Binatia bacterium]